MKRGMGSPNFDKAKQREIARKGGRAAHEQHTAHEWTAEEARIAGQKGGRIAAERKAARKAAVANCGCWYHAEQGIPCEHDLAVTR